MDGKWMSDGKYEGRRKTWKEMEDKEEDERQGVRWEMGWIQITEQILLSVQGCGSRSVLEWQTGSICIKLKIQEHWRLKLTQGRPWTLTMEAWRLKMEPWRVCEPVVADSHNFFVWGAGSGGKVKSGIRIRVKNFKSWIRRVAECGSATLLL